MVIGALLMLSLVVDAQPTVNEDESCASLDETATARNVELMKEDLKEVKNLLGSRQQSCSALDSSSLCEYKTRFSYKCSVVDRFEEA